MNHAKTHVLKFGGTSLQNKAFIEQAAQIVADRAKTVRPAVVVSAIAGSTDILIKIANDPENSSAIIDKLEQKHIDLFQEFIIHENGKMVKLQSLFSELRRITSQKGLRKEHHKAWRDQILSMGERASVIIFSAALTRQNLSSKPLTAVDFIKTDSNFGEARVKTGRSRKHIQNKLQNLVEIPVITGFIASDNENRITTLGRSGSDYTAGIVADALNAERLEIWTDVDGVLTADPRWVPDAQNIEALSFEDIEELSAHGADVIHPKTIYPIRGKETSVLVKNSLNPTHPGTTIGRNFSSNGSFKTITLNGPFVLLQIGGQYVYSLLAMLKVLSKDETNVFTFRQNSQAEPTRFLINQTFFNTIKSKFNSWKSDKETDISLRSDIYQVKKFSNTFEHGEQLTNRVWDLLVASDLQPLHINRNRNERFISLLFYASEALRAARLFDNYLQKDKKVVNLFIAGTGAVGETLMRQLRKIKTDDVEFRVTGICNSRKMYWDERGIDFSRELDWSGAEKTNWNSILKKLTDEYLHNVIFVDATGSEKVARLYLKLFRNGIHVVTPSKLANTFEQSFFDKLQTEIMRSTASFRYETTVGAGLPVISAIQNLQKSGDTITEISGVVSGTMTFIFNQLKEGIPFSKAVIKARELGYAEPDPRDDLSGEDAARKFLTLARTAGLKVEREALQVQSLIPEKLIAVDSSTFLSELVEYDGVWKKRLQKARKNNETLQYTGRLKDGKINIGIQSVPFDTPLGQLKGTDNLIQIFTKYYSNTPLVIQGPGAGKEVTAAGVITDVLKIVESL